MQCLGLLLSSQTSFPCEERRVHISVSLVSAKRLDLNLWMRKGKAFLCCPGQRLGIHLYGGFYLRFSPAETEKLVFKRAFFQGYQHRLALSAGVQVKLQMDVFTPGKMERKERENVSGYV